MTALKIATEAPSEPVAEIYTITPALARRWLARNVRNRNIRTATVRAYARDISGGRWQMTGEAIKFDTNGALTDGQHRLSAVVAADTPVRMLVVKGVEPEAQKVMDSGVKRSVMDSLSLDGRSHVSVLASAARLALTEPAAGFVSGEEVLRATTHSEIATFIDDMGDNLTSAAQVASHYAKAIDAPSSVICVAWMRLSNVDHEAAAEFFSSIADCRTDGRGDPRLTYIRRLAALRKANEKATQYVHLSLLFRTWNFWRAGQRVQNLPTRIGADPVRVPEKLR